MAMFKAPARRDEAEPVSANDALQFWQREVYYYEGRAGEQGASAGRMVTVAAGSTAVLPLIANTVNAQAVTLPFDVRLLLLVVPVLMFLLWTSAIRLLHEMHLLRVYVQRAERELKALTDQQPALKAYTRWADHGLAHDFSYYVMLVWFFSALILSVGGTFGITIMVVNLVVPDLLGLAVGVLVVAATILVFSFVDTRSDVNQIKWHFGLETAPPRQAPPEKWLTVTGLVASGVLVAVIPASLLALHALATPRPVVLWVLGAFIEAVAIVGAVAGALSGSSAERSVGRVASKTLVGVALGGGIACVVLAAAGMPGL